MILTILKSKGPTAHLIFVQMCLVNSSSCSEGHNDLYRLLSVPEDSLKRRAPTDTTLFREKTTAVTKRYPIFLDTPKGITTMSYIQKMAEIREHHQTGGQDSWAKAEEIIQEALTQEISLEMKIVLILESCNPFILDKKPEEVESRVEQAQKMCMVLHRQESNAQVLDGRCQWVLSRMHKLLGNLQESKKHLESAFSLLGGCEPGESNMLASFMQGCILLDFEGKSIGDQNRTINAFKIALSIASHEDFGTKIIPFCKIRLAQAYINSSVRSPGKSEKEIPRVNREDAKKRLGEIDLEDLKPRTKCLYFMTCSDVYRTDGQIEEAIAYAQQAMEFAQENNLSHEVEYIEKRQKLLTESRN